MTHGTHRWRALRGFLAAAAIITLFGSGSAFAQRWEWVYGSPGCIETGLHGVKQRAVGGYVAVGESFQQPGGCGTSDAYVVVTNGLGGLIWSSTYQIGTNSRATDVLELPNGNLIVCGYTQLGPPCQPAVSLDIFVLELTAGGMIVNWNTYGGPNSDEVAWKIIRTTIGNGVNTFAGDYVIAGSSTNQNVLPNRGGYLLRVTAGLALIWDRQYGTAANDDYFYGVDEVPAGFVGAGDVVAAGGSTSPPAIATDIFLVRANGNTGMIGGAPQGQSWTNFPGAANSVEEAHSVIVLRNGPFAGQIVVAGYTTGAPAPSANDEAFVVEFTANPCNQVANVFFGDNGPGPDRASDLVEDANPTVAGGDVVVTGYTTIPGGFGFRDVFLQRVMVGPGMALVGAAGDFGGNGIDEGGAVSNAVNNVAPQTPGYIVNGLTQSPNLIGADPRELYLIKTDLALTTPCSVAPIFPRGVAPNGTVCGAALGPNIGLQCQPPIVRLNWQWAYSVCPPPPPPPNGNQLGSGGNDGAAGVNDPATTAFNEGSLLSYPNPLASGDVLNLRFDMKSAATAHVAVSDVTGHETYRNDVGIGTGSQLVPVSTDGWPAGTYLVRVTIGTVTATSHVVVLKK